MDLLNFLMMVIALLLLAVCVNLSGIDKKLDRIADVLSKTEYKKNEENNDDKQID